MAEYILETFLDRGEYGVELTFVKKVFRPFTRKPDPRHKYFEDKDATHFDIKYCVVCDGRKVQVSKGGFLFTDLYQDAKRVAREQGGQVWELVNWWIVEKHD